MVTQSNRKSTRVEGASGLDNLHIMHATRKADVTSALSEPGRSISSYFTPDLSATIPAKPSVFCFTASDVSGIAFPGLCGAGARFTNWANAFRYCAPPIPPRKSSGSHPSSSAGSNGRQIAAAKRKSGARSGPLADLRAKQRFPRGFLPPRGNAGQAGFYNQPRNVRFEVCRWALIYRIARQKDAKYLTRLRLARGSGRFLP